MVCRKIFGLLILSAAVLSADWVRRADIQGNITDVAYPADQSAVYVATDGAGVWLWALVEVSPGVWEWRWEERNSGLDDLRIRALVVRPDNAAFLKAAAVSGLVYKSANAGVSWTLDSAGLDAIGDAYVPTDLSMAWNDVTGQQQWYTYMATVGAGVLRQDNSGGWAPFNNGLWIQKDFLSVAACSLGTGLGHQVLAGSRFSPSEYMSGNVYRYDFVENLWVAVSGLPQALDFSVPSIAFHQPDLAVAALTVSQDGSGNGVYYSVAPAESTGTWSQVGSSPPDHSFLAVDYVFNGLNLIISAGTAFGLAWVESPFVTMRAGGAPSPYQYFCKSRGRVTAVGLLVGDTGYAGGPGKGPIRFNPINPLECPVNQREGMQDNNVLDIVPSPSFEATTGGDDTIFAASGIAGMYKNVDPISPGFPPQEGYFYRMIGDPDSWGIPQVLKIRPVPIYNETGCQPNRTVFAATNGKGILRSMDGGRSWAYANGGSPILGGGVVTDIAFDPGYNGDTNETLYASVYGRGVYTSTNNGDSWFAVGFIGNPRVLCLAIASDGQLFAGCRTFNLPAGQDGLFLWNGLSWEPQGASSLTGISISAIGLPPSFPTPNWILLGTEGGGVFFSNNGGTSFSPINTNLPSNAQIFDLKLAPLFNPSGDSTLLIAVRPTDNSNGGVYVTTYDDGGSAWRPWSQITTTNGLPSNRVISVAFSPQYDGFGTVFCGHATRGLFFTSLDPTQPSATTWQPSAGFFNVPPDVAGLSVSPDDPDTVFAATLRDGIFISRDAGDTFRPWGGDLYYGAALCPVQNTLSVAATHQVPPPQNLFIQEDFSGVLFPSSGWDAWDGGTWGPNNRWRRDGTPCNRNLEIDYPGLFSGMYAILDSDCEGNTATQNDWLVSAASDTSSAERILLQFNHFFKIYSGAEHGYVKVCSSATGAGDCSSQTGNWVTVKDYPGQDFQQRVTMDLTPWKGTGMRVAFHYTGSYDYWWALDDVQLIQLLPRVVVGTKDRGIYYADAGDTVYFGQFVPSNVQAGTVNEVRYDGISEDMRASHVPDGDFSSADYGATWTQVPGVTPGLGLRDVHFSSASGWDRGLNGFIWGCSSGKTLSRGIGDGAAWYYDPLHDCNPGTGGIQACWQECPQTGLDPNGDYRSILQPAPGILLMGAIGKESSSTWTGLYRSDDACTTWRPSGTGLPSNPMVYAFQANSTDGYVLASVVDSNLADGDNGGLFYSESSSGGRAWAKTNLPSSAPSSYDMAAASDGSALYTGLSSDGIFSTLPSTISIVKPAAYFEVAAEACVGLAVQFYNYSAGKVTINAWAFGDGQASDQVNPSYAFTEAGTYYPSLTVTSGVYTDAYPDTLNAVSIVAKDELDLGSSLRITKTGTPDEIMLAWTDVNGESQYRVYASNSPAAPQISADLPADTVSFPTSANYAYFRIQPLGASFACGDGVTGGTW